MALTLFYFLCLILLSVGLYPFAKSMELNFDSSFYQILKSAVSKKYFNKNSLICGGIFFVAALAVQYLAYRNLYIYSFSSIFTLFFLFLIATAAICDKNKNIIPDFITYPLILFGFAGALNSPFIIGFEDAVLGAILGYMLPSIIGFAYEMFKGKQGIGSGDIKFLAGIGAWLGVVGLVYSVFFTSIISVICLFILKKRNVPFAPYALAGILIYLFYLII